MTARQAIIAAMPRTIAGLVMQTGYSRTLIKRHIVALRDAGETHIGAWDRTSGSAAPIHWACRGEDVPKPARKTSTELSREHRARIGRSVRSAGMLPLALMAQQRAFPLAGVWV